jgi:hypothetical protein
MLSPVKEVEEMKHAVMIKGHRVSSVRLEAAGSAVLHPSSLWPKHRFGSRNDSCISSFHPGNI